MVSGNQLYFTDQELRKIKELCDDRIEHELLSPDEISLLGNIRNKMVKNIRPPSGEKRPLKFLKKYKYDTPLPFEVVSVGYGKDKYYEVMKDNKIRSPYGFGTYEEAQNWAKENL